MSEIISSVFGLIWAFVWITIVFKIIRKAKGASGAQGASQRQASQLGRFNVQQGSSAAPGSSGAPGAPGASPFRAAASPARPSSAAAGAASRPSASLAGSAERAEAKAAVSSARAKNESYKTLSSILKEDREHDWMARQRAEDARAFRRNFSDLGAMHQADCAADELKKSHKHDYGVSAIDSPEKNAVRTSWGKKTY